MEDSGNAPPTEQDSTLPAPPPAPTATRRYSKAAGSEVNGKFNDLVPPKGRKASSVQKSTPNEPNPLNPMEEYKKAAEALGTAPPNDSTEDPDKTSKIIEKCKGVLTAKGLNTDLVLNVSDVEEVEEEVDAVQQKLATLELFSTSPRAILPSNAESGLLIKETIPFHIIGVSVLMHGEADFIEYICKLWKENVEFVTRLASKKALEILKRVMCKHVRGTAKMYYVLLSASDYPGLCKERGRAIIQWIKKVQTEATICWNQEKQRNLLRVAWKANAYQVKETVDEEQQKREGQKWTAE